MKNKLLLSVIFILSLIHGSDVLVVPFWVHFPEMFVDSARARGINIHNYNEEGWFNLNNVSAVVLDPLGFQLGYACIDSVMPVVLNFCRQGGTVLIWMGSDELVEIDNAILSFPGWETGIVAHDLGNYFPETVKCYIDFPPFTDSLGTIVPLSPYILECNNNAFPFMFIDTLCSKPVAAVSYPFVSEGNCSSTVIVFTGTSWFTDWRCGNPVADDYKFALKVLSVISEPNTFRGSLPGGGNICDRNSNTTCLSLPSPFTPNGDGINDFCQFSFPDMMFSPAVIRIYDVHSVLIKDIQVPLGWAAKSAARWYGKDNSGKPVPQGVYLYEIEQNGEVICTGTVTVAR